MKKIITSKNRILLKELVRTDFKLRYQDSALGYAWSLLRPLFLFGILYLVFGLVLKFGKDIPNYPIYLLLGIVIWNFFTEVTKQGSSSIVSRGSLLRKIHFPSYIIVLSSSISALINFGLNLLVVLAFIIIGGADIQWYSAIIAPLLIIELYIFSLSAAFILAAVNVKYRDIQHIWDIVIQAGFYATPIIYPLSLIVDKSEKLGILMMTVNPIAQIVQDLRAVLVTPQTETLKSLGGHYYYYLVPFAIITSIAIFSVFFFRKRAKYFTEEL